MAYTPKTWQCGEPIMADDLNHMEQGIAQGGAVAPLIVHQQAMTAEEVAEVGITGVSAALRLDTPTATIKQAFQSGRTVLLNQHDSWAMMIAVGTEYGTHMGTFASVAEADVWRSPSTYPYLIKTISSGGDV